MLSYRLLGWRKLGYVLQQLVCQGSCVTNLSSNHPFSSNGKESWYWSPYGLCRHDRSKEDLGALQRNHGERNPTSSSSRFSKAVRGGLVPASLHEQMGTNGYLGTYLHHLGDVVLIHHCRHVSVHTFSIQLGQVDTEREVLQRLRFRDEQQCPQHCHRCCRIISTHSHDRRFESLRR